MGVCLRLDTKLHTSTLNSPTPRVGLHLQSGFKNLEVQNPSEWTLLYSLKIGPQLEDLGGDFSY